VEGAADVERFALRTASFDELHRPLHRGTSPLITIWPGQL
jgi:hypothetical protein